MRYTTKKYGAWWWAVVDNTTNLYVRNTDGKLLLYKNKNEAQRWCDENNKEI